MGFKYLLITIHTYILYRFEIYIDGVMMEVNDYHKEHQSIHLNVVQDLTIGVSNVLWHTFWGQMRDFAVCVM